MKASIRIEREPGMKRIMAVIASALLLVSFQVQAASGDKGGGGNKEAGGRGGGKEAGGKEARGTEGRNHGGHTRESDNRGSHNDRGGLGGDRKGDGPAHGRTDGPRKP